MIACRSLISVCAVQSRPCSKTNKFQQLITTVTVGEFLGRSMDGEKRNKVSCVWRKVSTQSGSSQGEIPQPGLMIGSENLQVITDGKKNEAGSQGRQVHEKHAASMEVASSTVKHSSSIQVCPSLIRFIKGKGETAQRKLEEETGVQIIFSSSKKEDSIIIEGDSAESVTRASNRIQEIINEAVKSPSFDYTHFISLPLAIHPQLVDKLIKFQKSILGTYEMDQELGIERSIFINPKTFHLTVLVLKLWNKDLVKAAAEVLQSVSLKVFHALDAQPVSIRLKGLECMKGSFSKARVLYAPVEEIGGEDRLLGACQIIIDAFVEAGLVLEKDAKHKLKLHATVMNTRYRKRNARTRTNYFFDARGIVDQYGSEDWGVYLIREAHLSEMFGHDQNGYYHRCASIPFP